MLNPRARSNAVAAPLVVDLDGTLTPTDTLWESLVRLVKAAPVVLLQLPLWLLAGRAALKSRIAERLRWSGQGVPLNDDLVAYLQEQKRAGRRLVLATAANERIARTVAERLEIFDDVIASTASVNLKGTRKLQAIVERVGSDFIYAGDSRADLPIWAGAKAAVVVGSAAFCNRVGERTPIERHFESPNGGAGALVWMKALRAHQWLKNVLIFVPLLTSFSLTQGERLGASLLAFVSFCLAASATYLVNDLWDLDSDREHPRKRNRPLAAGKVTVAQALGAAFLLMSAAFAVAWVAGPRFSLLLLAYVVLTSAYSWWLKRFVVADVLTLACLYTLRILAGAVAIGVVLSSWLLAFSIFLFFGLAIVKRCAELVTLEQQGKWETAGRNYKVADLKVLWPMGVGASLCSVVVFGMFISSPETVSRYATPQMIWLAAPGLMYWLTRLWIKTARGEMHDDPLVFAVRDRNSCATVAVMVVIALLARFVSIGW
jgi:4-hydroxybenzoate polyprenyltransferase/phosphoserine phosphatase